MIVIAGLTACSGAITPASAPPPTVTLAPTAVVPLTADIFFVAPDGDDANPGDGICETAPGNGECTLDAAVQEGNALGRADIYRFDNAPHSAWRRVATYPAHFHNGSDEQVETSDLSRDPSQAIRQVLTFIRRKLHEEKLKQVQSGE